MVVQEVGVVVVPNDDPAIPTIPKPVVSTIPAQRNQFQYEKQQHAI